MIDAIAGILLVLVAGICVLAFPFVLWMLFGDAPRSRPALYLSPAWKRHRRAFVRSEDHKEAPPPYEEAEEEDCSRKCETHTLLRRCTL